MGTWGVWPTSRHGIDRCGRCVRESPKLHPSTEIGPRGARLPPTARTARDRRTPRWEDGGMDLDPAVSGRLRRNDAGLVPAIAQQHDTGEVLMLGWMDDEALARTLATGRATYWSRSRGEYWVKGETSGHRQWVKAVRLDCDGDTLLLQVDQEGPACHTGARTCFDADLLWEADAESEAGHG